MNRLKMTRPEMEAAWQKAKALSPTQRGALGYADRNYHCLSGWHGLPRRYDRGGNEFVSGDGPTPPALRRKELLEKDTLRLTDDGRKVAMWCHENGELKELPWR